MCFIHVNSLLEESLGIFFRYSKMRSLTQEGPTMRPLSCYHLFKRFTCYKFPPPAMVSQLHVQDTKLSWLDNFLAIDILCY